MKRAINIIVIYAAITATVNAQYFVEGSIAVDFRDEVFTYYGRGVAQPHKPVSDFYFAISPIVGYRLNDKISVGTKTSFTTEIRNAFITDTTVQPDLYPDFERRQLKWSFGLLGRYKILGIEKWSFLVESSVFIGGGITEEKTTGANAKKTESRSSIGIESAPLVTYDISDRWSLITKINFLTFGATSNTLKNEETGLKTKRNLVGFYAQDFSPLSWNIGFIYHF